MLVLACIKTQGVHFLLVSTCQKSDEMDVQQCNIAFYPVKYFSIEMPWLNAYILEVVGTFQEPYVYCEPNLVVAVLFFIIRGVEVRSHRAPERNLDWWF